MLNHIASYRNKAGLTQAELADLLGWKASSRIGNYESGYRDPGLDEARAIVDALNKTGRVAVTIDDVFPPDSKEAA
jgi:putative transcriptional regulator